MKGFLGARPEGVLFVSHWIFWQRVDTSLDPYTTSFAPVAAGR